MTCTITSPATQEHSPFPEHTWLPHVWNLCTCSSLCLQRPSPSSLHHEFFQFRCPAQMSFHLCSLPQLPMQWLLLSCAFPGLASPLSEPCHTGLNGFLMSFSPRSLGLTQHRPGTQWEHSKWIKSYHRYYEKGLWTRNKIGSTVTFAPVPKAEI